MRTFAFLLFLPMMTFAGKTSSGGGDAVKVDFLAAADSALYSIKQQGSGLNPKIDSDRFKAAIDVKHIETTDTQLKDRGRVVDAYYDQAKDLIQINRSGWSSKGPDEKLRLAAHEIFRRMGVDDDRYQISRQLIPVDIVRFRVRYDIQDRSAGKDNSSVEENVTIQLGQCKLTPEQAECEGKFNRTFKVNGYPISISFYGEKSWSASTSPVYGLFATVNNWPRVIRFGLGNSTTVNNEITFGTETDEGTNHRAHVYLMFSPWDPLKP